MGNVLLLLLGVIIGPVVLSLILFYFEKKQAEFDEEQYKDLK